MNEKTVWMNAYSSGYLSGVFPNKEEADELDGKLVDHHGRDKWNRTACLQFKLCWEDGQGLDSPLIEVHAEGGEK